MSKEQDDTTKNQKETELATEETRECCACGQCFPWSTMQAVSGDWICEECLDAAL